MMAAFKIKKFESSISAPIPLEMKLSGELDEEDRVYLGWDGEQAPDIFCAVVGVGDRGIFVPALDEEERERLQALGVPLVFKNGNYYAKVNYE